jgi:hypothetical protein
MEHPARHFVNGPVAARSQDDIAARFYFVPRLACRAARSGGRHQPRVDALLRQQGNHSLELRHVPRQAAGNRIIDDSGALRAERFQDHIVNTPNRWALSKT